MRNRPLLAFALGFGVAGFALSQNGTESRTFGTVTDSLSVLGSWAFQLEGDSTQPWSTFGDAKYTTGGMGCFDASVNLPGGAVIDSFDLLAHDSSSAAGGKGVYAELDACETADDSGCNVQKIFWTSGAPGYVVLSSGPVGTLVDNDANLYTMRVCTFAGDITTRFRAVRIHYRLRVSPAPATATFGDVPTDYIYFRAIEALAKSGIASGCGGGNFCPGQAVTRGELAKFLANALGLSFP